MTDASPKRAVLAALSHEPNFSGLLRLPSPEIRAGCNFLRWLDQSGLTLTFLWQLEKHGATSRISRTWRDELGDRQTRNFERSRDMLNEVQRIDTSFRSFGVRAALLKGFSLCPDFCDHPCIRHQSDLDFLVDPASLQAAAEALRSCGYTAPHLNETGETCFVAPLQHIPSSRDDLYALQRHRQVDLHTSIWEPCPWLPIEVPQDRLAFARPQNTLGVDYLSLSLEDKFLVQVLHAFWHSFRSWIRLSWLLEIAKFIDNHREDLSLWKRIIQRAGSSALTKSIFGFVLGLGSRLFGRPAPSALTAWTATAMTPSLRAWLDYFAIDWAISDWPGSLNNLFLAAEFIADPDLRAQYWRSRLLPRKSHSSIGSVATVGTHEFLRLQAARLSYVAHRAAVHLKDIAALPWQQLRWRRALESSRRPGLNQTAEWHVHEGGVSYGNHTHDRLGNGPRRLTKATAADRSH
jgi:Uncharacterised nucleotidyltransferase